MKAKDKRFHIRLEIDEEDGGYTVSIPELPGCISCGDTVAEALLMIQDAMSGWLSVAAKYNDPIPAQFNPVMKELRVLEELKATVSK
jgi:antitoxin HicB